METTTQATGLNLTKGERVDLTKGNKITELNVGLSWNKASGTNTVDADAFAVCLDSNGKLYHHDGKQACLYFNSPSTNNPNNNKEKAIIPVGSDWALVHSGDSLTGGDEIIKVNIDKLPSDVNQVLFFANIYDAKSKGQNFGQAEALSIRAYGKGLPQEIKFNLSEDMSAFCCIQFAKIYKHTDEWKFQAVGEGSVEEDINVVISKY